MADDDAPVTLMITYAHQLCCERDADGPHVVRYVPVAIDGTFERPRPCCGAEGPAFGTELGILSVERI